MREDLRRRAVAGMGQFGRPEQRVEVEDVLADEVVELGARIGPEPVVEVEAVAVAQVPERAHVADRRVEPDVVVLARRIGDLEAEIGRVARDVPVGQLVLPGGAQPFLHLVGGFRLQCAALLAGVAAQEGFAARVGELEEVVLGSAQLGPGAGYGRVRVVEVGRRVGGATGLAVVAVLVGGAALRALALDEAVGQEHLLDRVVELLDGAHVDQPGRPELQVDVVGAGAGFVRVRRVVIVETDQEAGEIARVLAMDALDQHLRRDALLLGAQHDRRAVRVVGADVPALVAEHLLEAYPDVGLDVFDEVAEVDRAIGVRQGGGDENLARHGGARSK